MSKKLLACLPNVIVEYLEFKIAMLLKKPMTDLFVLLMAAAGVRNRVV